MQAYNIYSITKLTIDYNNLDLNGFKIDFKVNGYLDKILSLGESDD